MGLLIEPALDYLIESYLISDKVSTCLYQQRGRLKNDFLSVDHSWRCLISWVSEYAFCECAIY